MCTSRVRPSSAAVVEGEPFAGACASSASRSTSAVTLLRQRRALREAGHDRDATSGPGRRRWWSAYEQ